MGLQNSHNSYTSYVFYFTNKNFPIIIFSSFLYKSHWLFLDTNYLLVKRYEKRRSRGGGKKEGKKDLIRIVLY